MYKSITTFFLLCIVLSEVRADTIEQEQAKSFLNIYSALCLRHLTNPTALRSKLEGMPQLADEGAAQFLTGKAGSAWPVPDKNGHFVLTLDDKSNLCSIHGRRADTEFVKSEFVKLVSSAPTGLAARELGNETKQISAQVQTNTITYEWSSAANPTMKVLFVLTTSPSASAPLQVLGSAVMVGR